MQSGACKALKQHQLIGIGTRPLAQPLDHSLGQAMRRAFPHARMAHPQPQARPYGRLRQNVGNVASIESFHSPMRTNQERICKPLKAQTNVAPLIGSATFGAIRWNAAACARRGGTFDKRTQPKRKTALRRLRIAPPTTPKPVTIIAQLDASGTGGA